MSKISFVLRIIHDSAASGPENMRRDQNLLDNHDGKIILRFYDWFGSWASYGYFQNELQVRTQLQDPSLSLVRRPTGGGIVDHRHDLTYSLILPRKHPLCQRPRKDCYCTIHQALQTAFPFPTSLAAKTTKGAACFQAPAAGDILDASGKKIAGAAQRRTRTGLLHQGSIQALSGQKDLKTTLTQALQNLFESP